MCIFSRPITSVTSTILFARLSGSGTQFLVYQMEYESEQPNAMILPLPVGLPANEESVRFISLEGYDDFFRDLDKCFPWIPPPAGIGCGSYKSAVTSRALAVHQVGDYVASFVPTLADFSRLDPQFVIRQESWDKIPQYSDYGFAVFQLIELGGKPHPMAFEFSSRLIDQLFFPTVHIHDGEVHELEEFDHTLYLQHESLDGVVGGYVNLDVIDHATGLVRSKVAAGKNCKTDLSKGIVRPELLVHRREIRGRQINQDTCENVSLSLGPLYGLRRKVQAWWPAVTTGAAVLGLAWLFRRRTKLMAERKQDT